MSTTTVPQAAGYAYNQAPPTGKGDSDLGKDDFLLLLVTQFQYQDPLNPMEDKEFIAQLAQFSSLEQLMNLNESMMGLTAATYEQQMLNATSFIGKNVIARGNQISKEDGLAPTVYQYALSENMVEGDIQVFDADGVMIYLEVLGERATGATHKFEWNGKNMKGEEAPDGTYFVRMSARNADGLPIFTDSQVEGTIESVVSESDGLKLLYDDGRWVYLSEVNQVSNIKKEENPEENLPHDKDLEAIHERMHESTMDLITKMEKGIFTKEQTQTRVEKKLREGAAEVSAWADQVLDDRKYEIKEVREMVDFQHKRFTILYDLVDAYTYDVHPDLKKINDKMSEFTAGAIEDMEAGLFNKTETQALVATELRKGAVELDAWATKELEGEIYTSFEINTMVAQQHKNFTAHYNSIK